MLNSFLGMLVDIEISGDKKHSGILIDLGQDILVIYNGKQFLYIPLIHVQHLELNLKNDLEITRPTASPLENEMEISYRKILSNAKGTFLEIYIAGNQSIHGYITNIMTDYFVFYSPVFKTMFIPLFHLKWLIPYMGNQTPYSLDKEFLPVNPSSLSLSRTFEEQLAKLRGKIVVFDMGLSANKVGLLQKIQSHMIELVTAGERKMYCNIQHIKAVHSPNL